MGTKLIQPLTENEVKKIGVTNLKKEYIKLADFFYKILDGKIFFCHMCNEFHNTDLFYNDKRYGSGLFPICKKCLLKMATDYNKTTNTYTDNKEKTIEVFHLMNLPYIESLYQSSLKQVKEKLGEVNRSTAYQQMMVQVKSLPQYSKLSWKDSIFGDSLPGQTEEEINENSRIVKAARKRFGRDYSLQDLYFLETQYEDWVSRYECNTKAQEEIFERLCFKKWEINKATKNGQPTKDLDKTYQELLSTANITPRQSSMDTFADAQTFGTLLQKYEETRPLPEIDEDLRDVDKIGLYIDAFFRGHASKMLGLKNPFTNIYEKVMSKYTVKPPEYEDDEDTEDVFNKIFGSLEDY